MSNIVVIISNIDNILETLQNEIKEISGMKRHSDKHKITQKLNLLYVFCEKGGGHWNSSFLSF